MLYYNIYSMALHELVEKLSIKKIIYEYIIDFDYLKVEILESVNKIIDLEKRPYKEENLVLFMIFFEKYNLNYEDFVHQDHEDEIQFNNLMFYSIENLELILSLEWFLNNSDWTLELFSDERVHDIIKLSENELLKYTFEKLEIKTISDFNNFLKRQDFENFLILFKDVSNMIENDYEIWTKSIDYLIWLNLGDNIENIIKNWTVEFITYNTLWYCHENDSKNRDVLDLKDENYTLFLSWDKIIWFIKKNWNETFLALDNYYDEDWNLIFLKWIIYYFYNFKEYIKEDIIHLEDIINNKIFINPLRMSRIKNLDSKIKNFISKNIKKIFKNNSHH